MAGAVEVVGAQGDGDEVFPALPSQSYTFGVMGWVVSPSPEDVDVLNPGACEAGFI